MDIPQAGITNAKEKRGRGRPRLYATADERQAANTQQQRNRREKLRVEIDPVSDSLTTGTQSATHSARSHKVKRAIKQASLMHLGMVRTHDEFNPLSAMERWPPIGEDPGCQHCGVDLNEYTNLESRCKELEDELQKLRAEASMSANKTQ
ncbi:uncharacterized protein EI90DRAFT_3119684 [Cantharellus anzutake]|uniref:uncharacterized protein n=1 Tax=Cantharellus anzutake TaxID=1750568 RepID=UPI001906E411|nr:uncharacterized protein EI90DRAFT_3119684 [Cantharellus anzutake]KAF8336401.1 hypothetical protein EI90DRAFT_3119684 [Cantharellus anzutake]